MLQDPHFCTRCKVQSLAFVHSVKPKRELSVFRLGGEEADSTITWCSWGSFHWWTANNHLMGRIVQSVSTEVLPTHFAKRNHVMSSPWRCFWCKPQYEAELLGDMNFRTLYFANSWEKKLRTGNFFFNLQQFALHETLHRTNIFLANIFFSKLSFACPQAWLYLPTNLFTKPDDSCFEILKLCTKSHLRWWQLGGCRITCLWPEFSSTNEHCAICCANLDQNWLDKEIRFPVGSSNFIPLSQNKRGTHSRTQFSIFLFTVLNFDTNWREEITTCLEFLEFATSRSKHKHCCSWAVPEWRKILGCHNRGAYQRWGHAACLCGQP